MLRTELEDSWVGDQEEFEVEINFDELTPYKMASLKRWVCWKYVERKGGKPTKPPIDAVTGRMAESDNPSTWSSYDTALLACESFGMEGVGFMLGADPSGVNFTGIDLDDCLHDGVLEPWAADVVDMFKGSYMEESPSRKGIHIIVCGTLNAGMVKNPETGLMEPSTGGKGGPGNRFEIYNGGRYFTMTAVRYGKGPSYLEEWEDCSEKLQAIFDKMKAMRAEERGAGKQSAKPASSGHSYVPTDYEIIEMASKASGPKFLPLWTTPPDTLGGDDSANDMALCNLLAFYGQKDEATIDRLFRQSVRMREKWERDSYRNPTIARAVEGTNATFDWDAVKRPQSTGEAPAQEPRYLSFSDIGNGQRFARQHRDIARYCHQWKRWLIYDGRRWEADESGRADALAKQTAVSIYNEVIHCQHQERRERLAKHAAASAKLSSMRNMLATASSEPGMAVVVGALDKDPWSFNCANGTVNLETGSLRPHDPCDHITKISDIEYDPDATCPLWEKTLLEVMGGRQSLVDFVQRAAGLSMIGVIREHALFICHGDGANGKSLILGILRQVLGDYGITIGCEVLLKKKNGDDGSTEQADLFGRRLAVAEELEQGSRLSEATVKRLTGGSKIRARRLYENAWEFDPSHTLWLATNYRPIIRGADVGIWRRVKLVPFDVVFADIDQDKNLPEKLWLERRGILAWMIRGCLAYLKDGLGEPEEVLAATAQYRADQDALAEFFADKCTIHPNATCSSKDLFSAYEAWAKENGEHYVMSARQLGGEMSRRKGIERYTNNGTRYRGIEVVSRPFGGDFTE